eukprot:GHRQ01036071.1.p1 GENE.GHRQ01036071.1~~GHRQ01036071.1.p1  ORF type:complete len:167 (+),score=5.11 GHRQ01036071.1:377-877(+)
MGASSIHTIQPNTQNQEKLCNRRIYIIAGEQQNDNIPKKARIARARTPSCTSPARQTWEIHQAAGCAAAAAPLSWPPTPSPQQAVRQAAWRSSIACLRAPTNKCKTQLGQVAVYRLHASKRHSYCLEHNSQHKLFLCCLQSRADLCCLQAIATRARPAPWLHISQL